MLSRRMTAASALFAFTLASSAAAYAGKDKEQSARDDDDKPKKVAPDKGPDKVPGKGSDLAGRVEALERQVHELVVAMKASRGEAKGQPEHVKGLPEGKRFAEGKQPEGFKADFKKPDMKPGDKKPEGVKAEFKADVKKPEGKHAEADKKLPPPFDGKHVELMKGKDGQLYVPLSALPPGIQAKFREMTDAGHGEKGHQDKKSAKKGEDDDEPKKKLEHRKGDEGEKKKDAKE